MKTQEMITEAYADVALFNTLAGNLTNVTDESVDSQISFIFEELSETIAGMEALDRVEILDGACDLFVTVAGLLQKLESQGYNVAEALHRVNGNNLSKFPKQLAEIGYPAGWTTKLNASYGRWVIKDAAGKVRKPANFVPVDLSDLVGGVK